MNNNTNEISSSQSVSLTANEKAFLKMCRNYDTAEKQRGDNYSNAGIAEAKKLFNGNRNAAGGLIASLTNKGLGSLDIEFDQFCLSEAGIVAAFAE